ncbi:MAG: DNA repair protein RecN [Bacteroidota bacterium]
MIQSLKIKNYALIDEINIEFYPGFITITGETGAGKSILIGALSLILGNRADTSVLKDESQKCIVEASFDISKYNLQHIFEANDLDFEAETIIRREISSKGKSRAFINDTPVNIKVLKELGASLVDIHSQHHNLILKDNHFQLDILDAYAAHEDLVGDYKTHFQEYRKLKRQYENLKADAEKNKSDMDYYQFQYDQLEKLNLKEGEQEELEKELETLNHTEEIKYNLSNAYHLLSNEENSILVQLREAADSVKKIVEFFPKAKDVGERMESSYIELQDLSNEVGVMNENMEHDPERAEFIRQRLDDLYSLEHKHNVSSDKELIGIKEEFAQKLEEINSYDFKLEEIEKSLNQKKSSLKERADKISENRNQSIPSIEKHITQMLKELGIPNAVFSIEHNKLDEFTEYGQDEVRFLFSANKNIPAEEISRVASGGELSRLMLSLKSLLVETKALPTIIFDEIDSGTSGDIADKMGAIMQKMAVNTQVVNITHLPQIASKGNYHFLVYKEDDHEHTYTDIKQLTKEERVQEIAKMLSGEQLTETALQNAREFLET